MVLTNALIVGILIFTRIAAIFSLQPMFGAANIPMQVRIALIIMLTIIIYPVAGTGYAAQVETFFDLGFYVLMEILVGLSISIAMAIVYNALYLSGTIVDTSIGFSMINVMSAHDEGEIPLTANYYYLLAVMVFFVTDAHHGVLEAVWRSFKVLPVAKGILNLGVVDIFNAIFIQSFVIGVKIAAPFLLTILITDVILGLLSKAMPGFNVFMVGMPIKILLGLFLFYLMTPYMIGIFKYLNDLMVQYANQVIDLYRQGGL